MLPTMFRSHQALQSNLNFLARLTATGRIRTRIMQLNFGHSTATLTFWRKLVRRALARGTPTPFYLCSSEPIREALAELEGLDCGLPIRQWLSCKSQPVAHLLRWWLKQDRPIEVVSEFEFLAGLREGFKPEQILINGPAKHRWLTRYKCHGLHVNFDSHRELEALLPLALRLNWSLGIRCNTREDHDPDKPDQPTQFGFPFVEAVSVLGELRRNKARIETVHFHMRSNIESHKAYETAIEEVAEICRKAALNPLHLDIGGGLPQRHVLTPHGRDYAAHFNLSALATVLRRHVKQFPLLREVWFENGRFLCARSGVLVLKIFGKIWGILISRD